MRVCVLYVCDVCIFTGNSRTGAPYKGALRAGRKAGGVAGEKTFLPGRACGEPALRRNCERGLETVAQPGADAFFTEKGLCQNDKDLFSGEAGAFKDEHTSKAPVSPSNAVSISSSGICSSPF